MSSTRHYTDQGSVIHLLVFLLLYRINGYYQLITIFLKHAQSQIKEESDQSMRKSEKPVQKPKDLAVKPSDYQPSRKELREDQDMPGMSDKEVRDVFFRPFKFIDKD